MTSQPDYSHLRKPTLIKWFSLERNCQVEDVLDQDEAISAAGTLLRYGCPYVLLEDLTIRQMAEADAFESRMRSPITLAEHLNGEFIAGMVEGLFQRLDLRRKSPDKEA